MNDNILEISPEIIRGMETLFPAGIVVELRVPKTKKDGTLSGYFDDYSRLAQGVAELSGKHEGIYYTLNPCLPALTARSHNSVATRASATTTDNDIVSRRWLLIDIDPDRPKGISSSDEEKMLAKNKTLAVFAFLTERGWPEPVACDSGNGYHLLYAVDFPNTKEVTDIIKAFLKNLSERFDDAVKVDKQVFNAARIVKAYGSLACKGQNTSDRPHRPSKILRVPDTLTLVTLEQVASLSEVKPANAKPVKSGLVISNPNAPKIEITPDKVEEFLAFYELKHQPAIAQGDSLKWRIICPWADEHSNDHAEASVFLTNGVLGFKCFHDHCTERDWKVFRAYLEQVTDKKFFFKTNIAVTSASAPATSTLVITKASGQA